MLRSLDNVDVTKVAPTYPDPSPGVIRETLMPVFFGEHGANSSASVHWLALLVVAAALALAARALWRHDAAPAPGSEPAGVRRPAFWLLAGTGAGTLVLHVVAGFAGLDLFADRYLYALLPLSAALLGCGLALVRLRVALPLAAVAALGLAAAAFLHREDLPDLRPAEALARAAHADVVLTNNPVVAWYLRDLHVVLDRPFGLGAGLEQATRARGRPYAVVDDPRIGPGPRAGPEPAVTLAAPGGEYVVRVVPGSPAGGP
jgi:hypothetical protein